MRLTILWLLWEDERRRVGIGVLLVGVLTQRCCRKLVGGQCKLRGRSGVGAGRSDGGFQVTLLVWRLVAIIARKVSARPCRASIDVLGKERHVSATISMNVIKGKWLLL